jgi:hypothetical protein
MKPPHGLADFIMLSLLDTERLRVLAELAVVSSPTSKLYDEMTHLAMKIIDVPVALMSMVAADHQFFMSHVGLPEPWSTKRRIPLTHSFCQYVVATNAPLITSDAREIDSLKTSLAIIDLNVICYLGLPLTLSSGTSLGSFCVIDHQPRD